MSITEVRAAARVHTSTMIKVLHGVATSKDAPHSARNVAAISLLDRAWGKAEQTVSLEAGQSLLSILDELERRADMRVIEGEVVDNVAIDDKSTISDT